MSITFLCCLMLEPLGLTFTEVSMGNTTFLLFDEQLLMSRLHFTLHRSLINASKFQKGILCFSLNSFYLTGTASSAYTN